VKVKDLVQSNFEVLSAKILISALTFQL